MSKLSQEHLQYLSEHMLSCRKREGLNVNAKRRVLIKSDSDESGKKNSQILQIVYPDTVVKDDSGGYRDFSLQFETVWQRDQAVEDINKMVSDYRSAHPEITTGSGGNGSDDTTDTATSGNKTYLYVVIGAAAIILILLLWDNKKR